MDETKRAIDKIFQSSKELDIMLGRAHTRLGTLGALSAEVEQDLSAYRNLCSTTASPKSSSPTVTQDKVDLPAPELHRSDLRPDSTLSLFIRHLGDIANYERALHRSSELTPQGSHQSIPPKPSREVYSKVALVTRMVEHLFLSPSNPSPSSNELAERTSDPSGTARASSSLSTLHLPEPLIPPTRRCSTAPIPSLPPPPGLPIPSHLKPNLAVPRSRSWESLKAKAKEILFKGKGKEKEEVDLMEEYVDLEVPDFWEEQEWED